MLYPTKNNMQAAALIATPTLMAICVIGLSVAAATPASANAAFASADEEGRTKIVRYGDLDLASTKGVKILQRRIRLAAKEVCASEGIVSILQHRKIRKCADAAHDNAWASVHQRIGDTRLAVRIQR
jgi:UrcA family protein